MRRDDDGAAIAPDRRAVLVPGTGTKRDANGAHSKQGTARKQFDRLIERLKSQRQEIARWQTFKHAYHQQLMERYEPLARRLRDKRIAMVKLLDRALDGRALTRREDLEARATVNRLLQDLLAESADDDLVALHDKYAEVSFAEDKRERLEALRHFARQDFGVDVDAYQGPESPEDFTDWLEDQAGTERSAASRSEPKGGARGGAQQASHAVLAEGGRQAVREVFRKLASELHPDRETDPIEQARKTAIMQRVNQAYKAGDLLTLLELQFVGAPVDGGVLAGVAKQRLRHYVQVLKAQSRKLRDELAAITAPFTAASGSARVRKLTPDVVQRALDTDIRELKHVLREVELDLIRFRDIGILKQSLRSHR